MQVFKMGSFLFLKIKKEEICFEFEFEVDWKRER